MAAETETHTFAQFDHPLLQVDVLLEAGMTSSDPEDLVGERKLWIVLLPKTDVPP